MYELLPDPSLNRMVEVVKGAVNLCSGVYISVGFFGYVTFLDVEGNILTAFAPSLIVEAIKMGFVLSVAVSFPIVMFPIRTSLHSLLFRKVHIDYIKVRMSFACGHYSDATKPMGSTACSI